MTHDMLRTITDEDLRAYEEDGVLWVRGILDQSWVILLAKAVEDMLVHPIAQMVDFTGLGMAMAQEAGRSGIWKGDNSWNTATKISQDVLLDERSGRCPGRGVTTFALPRPGSTALQLGSSRCTLQYRRSQPH